MPASSDDVVHAARRRRPARAPRGRVRPHRDRLLRDASRSPPAAARRTPRACSPSSRSAPGRHDRYGCARRATTLRAPSPRSPRCVAGAARRQRRAAGAATSARHARACVVAAPARARRARAARARRGARGTQPARPRRRGGADAELVDAEAHEQRQRDRVRRRLAADLDRDSGPRRAAHDRRRCAARAGSWRAPPRPRSGRRRAAGGVRSFVPMRGSRSRPRVGGARGGLRRLDHRPERGQPAVPPACAAAARSSRDRLDLRAPSTIGSRIAQAGAAAPAPAMARSWARERVGRGEQQRDAARAPSRQERRGLVAAEVEQPHRRRATGPRGGRARAAGRARWSASTASRARRGTPAPCAAGRCPRRRPRARPRPRRGRPRWRARGARGRRVSWPAGHAGRAPVARRARRRTGMRRAWRARRARAAGSHDRRPAPPSTTSSGAVGDAEQLVAEPARPSAGRATGRRSRRGPSPAGGEGDARRRRLQLGDVGRAEVPGDEDRARRRLATGSLAGVAGRQPRRAASERAHVVGAGGEAGIVEGREPARVRRLGRGADRRGGGAAVIAHGLRRRRASSAGSRAISAPASRRSPPRRAAVAAQAPRRRLELRARRLERGAGVRAPRRAEGRAAPRRIRADRRRARAPGRPRRPGEAARRAARRSASARRERARSARSDERRRGGARVLVADRALAEVGRAALARLHRHGRPRARPPRRPRPARRRRPAPPASDRRAQRRAPPARARRPSSCRRGLRRRGPHGGDARLERARQRFAVDGRRAPSERPAARRTEPHSGPLAPPTVETSVLPASTQQRPGGSASSWPASALPTAVKPRFMLMPWSPSPIAASSCVRWSACARHVGGGLAHPGDDGGGVHDGQGRHDRLHAPQRSAGVWTGASHSAVSSSSSSSSVSDAPAISSDVM